VKTRAKRDYVVVSGNVYHLVLLGSDVEIVVKPPA